MTCSIDFNCLVAYLGLSLDFFRCGIHFGIRDWPLAVRICATASQPFQWAWAWEPRVMQRIQILHLVGGWARQIGSWNVKDGDDNKKYLSCHHLDICFIIPETNKLHMKMVVSNRNPLFRFPIGIPFSRGLFSGAKYKFSGEYRSTCCCKNA